jgi:aerobic carbon-monoxide dehydrogenase small subunit
VTATIIVNGIAEKLSFSPGDMLADVLRAAGHVEVKKGCDTGNCGACTVLVDGTPILSCAYLAARAEGRAVTTVRGVEAEAAQLAAFMGAEGADQCGFCAPGFALTVIAMRREIPNPTDEQIKAYLNGNLCRCSGYESQHRAIRQFLEATHARH